MAALARPLPRAEVRWSGAIPYAVLLAFTLPILILYAVGRRQLLSGLTAGFSK